MVKVKSRRTARVSKEATSDVAAAPTRRKKKRQATQLECNGVEADSLEAEIAKPASPLADSAIPLVSHAVEETAPAEVEAEDRRGIVHLGSLPSGMQPEKLRHVMSQFGEVGRVYLAPEDKTEHQRRKKMGGNRKLRYSEGWVEFADRKIARRVAMTLNGTIIGGKKRHNFYRDDMWNLRYLPKFKWHQLKEATIYNQHVRKARLEQKLGQARKENEFFLEKVEQAKVRDRMARKQASKGSGEADAPMRQELLRHAASAPARKAVRSGANPAPHLGGAASTQISDKVLASLL